MYFAFHIKNPTKNIFRRYKSIALYFLLENEAALWKMIFLIRTIYCIAVNMLQTVSNKKMKTNDYLFCPKNRIVK